MKLTIKLNLDVLVTTSFTGTFYLEFDNITNLQYWYDEEDVTQLEFSQSSTYKQMYVFLNGASSPTYDEVDGNIVSLSENSDYIIFTCEIANSSYNRLKEFIDKGIIEVNQNGNTTIFAYKQNSENDVVNKTLTFVDAIDGKFNHMIGLKQINIDIKDYARNYNYIYIPSLNRYYYVDSVELVSADISRLHLKEDVLMSWKDLIKLQDAYVTRYGNATDKSLVDDRYPVKDIPSITYTTPTTTSGSSVVTLKYKMPNLPSSTEYAPNVFVVTKGTIITILPDNTNHINPPSGSGLPEIQSRRGANDHYYLLSVNEYNQMCFACLNNDAPATYIQSVLLMPFDLRDIFPDATSKGSNMYAGTKALGTISGQGIGWVNPSDIIATDPKFFETKKGSSPYIVIADFTFGAGGGISIENNYLDFSPNTLWEIYIPFVGWVQVDAKQIYNDRILIYYTFDFDTGLSTAYIYDRTKQKVIHSANCQIGIKLPLVVSNAEELARQQQATGLNLVMGILSSALSIGVGAYSGNAVAVMGGIMGASKTITSAVNTFNSMMDKGQITYGSSGNALYSSNNVVVRKTTHNKLVNTNTQEEKFAHINGYPYRKYVTLSAISTVAGSYIEVGEIHFDPKANDIFQDEITEIVELLKSGVIL